MALEVIKNIENISAMWVRNQTKEVIEYVKDSRTNRSISSIKTLGLSRRKSNGLKNELRPKKSLGTKELADAKFSSKKVIIT